MKTHFKFYVDTRWNCWLLGFTFWGKDFIREVNVNIGPVRVGVWITKGVF